MRIGNRQLLGVSLVSVGTLAFEIVMTRIFSVMMWYHFAFLAISLALMGSATAGVFLYWHPELIEPRRARPWISRLSLLLALSAPLSLWVYLQVPFAPALMNRTAWFSPLEFFWLAIIFLDLAVPFFLSGLVLALALTTWAAESGRVYWADLSGAAVGCLLSIAALELFGAAGAVLAITVTLALAAVIFALGRDVGRVTQRLVLGGMTVTLLLTAVQAVTPWLKITPGRLDQPPQYEHWSANAQVTVYEPANYRFFWSVSPSQWERTIAEGGSFPHTLLLIDAVAGIHDNPLRGLSYMALEEAAFTGLDGLTNALVANSGHDATLEQIRRQLFARPAVLAVAAVADLMASFDPSLDILVYSLSIMQVATLFIAFLIAFNSTSINIDDRIREVATMFAFGARPRTVTWAQIGENALLGVLGTAVGGVVGAVTSIVFQLRHFKTGRQLNATPKTVTPHLGHADRSYPDAPSAQKAWATQAVSRPLDGQSSDRHDHSPSLHRLQLVSLSGTGDSLDSAATRSAL